jgi:hypothetical protein
MKTCILCGKETEGSVGAAGIKWMRVCQPCKDSEDNALLQQIQRQPKVIDLVMGEVRHEV